MPAIKAYLAALLDHVVSIVGGGVVAFAVSLWERYSGKDVPGWVYIAVVVLGVLGATFQAWKAEYGKRVEAEARLADRPRLTLEHRSSDPLAVHEPEHGRPCVLRVAVVNRGPIRAKDVSVALHAIDPSPFQGASHFQLPEMHTRSAVFEVPAVADKKPTAHVDVIEQAPHGDGKYWYRLCYAEADKKHHGIALTNVTPRLKVTLRIEAEHEAEPYEMILEPDQNGRLRVVSESEHAVEFSSSLLPSWRERWGLVRKRGPSTPDQT